jgi:hypothetical protein
MYIFVYLAIKLLLLLSTSGLALLIIALSFSLIDIDQLSSLLNLSPEVTDALRVVISRIQEVTANIGNTITDIVKENTGKNIENININDVKNQINESINNSNKNQPEK